MKTRFSHMPWLVVTCTRRVLYFANENKNYRYVLFGSGVIYLTHCGQVTPYPNEDLGQHWEMAQVMACCLTATSHYLNQCEFLISEILQHSPESNLVISQQVPKLLFRVMSLKIVFLLYARFSYYAMAMSVRPSVRVFRTFFQHALRYQFETWYIHSVGSTTCRVWVESQLGHFDLVYSQK